MSDRTMAQWICQVTRHDWIEEYYGYKCSQCGEFIPYGSEPWLPLPDDDYEDEDDSDDALLPAAADKHAPGRMLIDNGK